MSTINQITSNGASAVAPTFAVVQDIWVEYDETNDRVTVTPGKVDKGATVRFKNPKGGQLRIVFLSPDGRETEPVGDSESCTLMIGGTYHFKCFFTFAGANGEISPESGGVIDVVPQRP
jgi:hypothetical protein